MIWKFIPVGPEETYEEFDFFFETDELEDSEKDAIAFIDETPQPEDIGLVESVQRECRTGLPRGVIWLTLTERFTNAVHLFTGLF